MNLLEIFRKCFFILFYYIIEKSSYRYLKTTKILILIKPVNQVIIFLLKFIFMNNLLNDKLNINNYKADKKIN